MDFSNVLSGADNDIFSIIRPKEESIHITGEISIAGEKVIGGYSISGGREDMFIYSIKAYRQLMEKVRDYEMRLMSMDNVVKSLVNQQPMPADASTDNNYQEQYLNLKQDTDKRIRDLEREVAELTTKLHNLKYRNASCNDARVKKSRKLASRIIGMCIDGMTVEEICNRLGEGSANAPSASTVYRAVSVTESEDRERILSLYDEYGSELEGVSRDALIQWFEASRIKRLGLVSIETLYQDYGQERVDKYLQERGFKPDAYVSGEYYRSCEMHP